MAKHHKCISLILLLFAGDIDVGLGRPLSLFLSLWNRLQSSLELFCLVAFNNKTFGAQSGINTRNSFQESIVLLNGKRNALSK